MRMVNRSRAYVYLFSILMIAIIICIFTTRVHRKPRSIFKTEFCYNMKYRTLPDISSSHAPPSNSIFFINTSCTSKLTISPQQACGIESAALLNPNRRVYLLYISPELEEDQILNNLRSYKNIHVHHLNVEYFFRKTPVENLFGKMAHWKNVQRELSHVLRFLVLWKYGGIYLDSDSVVMKSIEALPPNFVGLIDATAVGCSALGFSPVGQGHEVVSKCLEQLRKNLTEDAPGTNCVEVITREMKTACNVFIAIDMEGEICGGVEVFPGESFYPLRYKRHFYSDSEEQKMPTTTNETYVVHPWREFGKIDKQVGRMKNGQPYYVKFVEKLCPKTRKGFLN